MMEVLTYPNEILKQKSAAVDQITAEEIDQLNQMYDLMKASNGVGLAAPQVGILKRMVVIQTDEKQEPLKMINPKITARSSDIILFNEGCLSVPGEYHDVTRYAAIKFQYTNINGELVESEAEELLAVCIQHEIDHLDGKLFIDRLSKGQRSKLLKKYFEKQEQK